ncbi:hypothetical protein FS837_003133 [Tulasnella sp. UAMH 9824]|nr:hypothetical protein FS837_003133 [Tulasnella sp. UAMH 9824]
MDHVPTQHPTTQSKQPFTNPKADQILWRVFRKFVTLVADARRSSEDDRDPQDAPTPLIGDHEEAESSTTQSISTASVPAPPPAEEDPGSSEEELASLDLDKWFDVEISDVDAFKPALDIFKHISTTFPVEAAIDPPPLIVQTNKFASIIAPRYILLESWRVDITRRVPESHDVSSPTSTSPSLSATDTSPFEGSSLRVTYKQCITLFRSLYTLLRTLPAWRLRRQLRGIQAGSGGEIRLEMRVGIPLASSSAVSWFTDLPSMIDDHAVVGFDDSLSQHPSANGVKSMALPSVLPPLRDLNISLKYRLETSFTLTSPDSLSSSVETDRFSQPERASTPLDAYSNHPTANAHSQVDETGSAGRGGSSILISVAATPAATSPPSSPPGRRSDEGRNGSPNSGSHIGTSVPQEFDLIQDLASIESDSTPITENIVDLIIAIGNAIPKAIRNKHQLYRLLIRSRDLCNYLHRMLLIEGGSTVGVDIFKQCWEMLDRLECAPLDLKNILCQEMVPFAESSLATWNNSCIRLGQLYDDLTASQLNTCGLHDSVYAERDRYFDDCSWLSLVLEAGIEVPIQRMYPGQGGIPIEAQDTIDRLNYMVNEMKLDGDIDKLTRELSIKLISDIAVMTMKGSETASAGFWAAASHALNAIDVEKRLDHNMVDSLHRSWGGFVDDWIRPLSIPRSSTPASSGHTALHPVSAQHLLESHEKEAAPPSNFSLLSLPPSQLIDSTSGFDLNTDLVLRWEFDPEEMRKLSIWMTHPESQESLKLYYTGRYENAGNIEGNSLRNIRLNMGPRSLSIDSMAWKIQNNSRSRRFKVLNNVEYKWRPVDADPADLECVTVSGKKFVALYTSADPTLRVNPCGHPILDEIIVLCLVHLWRRANNFDFQLPEGAEGSSAA